MKTNIKKENSSVDLNRVKTEKMDDSPAKQNMNLVRDRRECVLLAAGSHLKSVIISAASCAAIGTNELNI